MTPMRKRMIHELQLHRKSPKTIEAYVTAVAQLARHYGCSPDRISLEQIREFLHYLIVERKLAFSSCRRNVPASCPSRWAAGRLPTCWRPPATPSTECC